MTTQPHNDFPPGRPARGEIVRVTKGPMQDRVLVVAAGADAGGLVLCREDQTVHSVDVRWLEPWPAMVEVTSRARHPGETDDEYRASVWPDIQRQVEAYLNRVEKALPEWLRREDPRLVDMTAEAGAPRPLPGVGKVFGEG